MSTTPHSVSSKPSPDARGAGAALLWLAALGGVCAWIIHLFVAWAVVEVGCLANGGSARILGLSPREVALLATAVPGVLATAALLLSCRLTHRELVTDGRRRLERAALMARLGMWLNAFALLMIGFGGVAIAAFPGCAS